MPSWWDTVLLICMLPVLVVGGAAALFVVVAVLVGPWLATIGLCMELYEKYRRRS